MPRAVSSLREITRTVSAIGLLIWLSAVAYAEEKIKFPIGVGTKTLGTSTAWVALKKGFFDEAGLDVQLILLRGTPITTQALVSESLYVALGSADATIGAAASGLDLLGVGGVVNGLTQAIVAGKNYKSFKDLRGSTVGVQALTSGATNVLKRIFKQNGLDYPADYKLLAVGGGSFNLAALTSGQIGATYLVVPLDYDAAQQGFNVFQGLLSELSAVRSSGEAELGGKEPRALGALSQGRSARASLALCEQRTGGGFFGQRNPSKA